MLEVGEDSVRIGALARCQQRKDWWSFSGELTWRHESPLSYLALCRGGDRDNPLGRRASGGMIA
jgi:hypothetical protein